LVAISFFLMPASAAAQESPAPVAPVNSWIQSKSASGIRASEAGIELRRGKGWIFTSALYADFALDVEFRIVDQGTQARLFVRAYPGDVPGAGSYSINLSDAVEGSAALASINSGRRDASATIEARRSSMRAVGEWQRLEVTCRGRSLQVSLNGSPIDAVDDVVPVEGVLGLAPNTGRLELRGLRLREYSPPAPPDLVADPGRGLYEPDHKSVSPPKLTKEFKPNYTASAMARKIQGVVRLKAVVLKDGTIGEVRVTRTLDRELDREAIAVIKKWRFSPALRDGSPVEVLVEIEMSFTLR
jgi:TonB family protein